IIKMKIKVCGLKHEDNILNVLELDPDYVGFIFHAPSKRFVGQLDAKWVGKLQGPKKTGVFVNSPLEAVYTAINAYGFQAIQLHGDESPEYCRALMHRGVEIIKAFGIGAAFDWKALIPY